MVIKVHNPIIIPLIGLPVLPLRSAACTSLKEQVAWQQPLEHITRVLWREVNERRVAVEEVLVDVIFVHPEALSYQVRNLVNICSEAQHRIH